MNEDRRGIIRIVIVDDHAVVRAGLRSLLSGVDDFEVVGEAGNLHDGIREIREKMPDVAVLDVRLPDGSGFDGCREVRERFPETRVLILTSYADGEIVRSSIKAGAHGYLLKEVGADDLVSAIRRIAAGQSIIDPSLVGKVFESVKRAGSDDTARLVESLSAQEMRVIALVADGLTNKEIGVRLNLAEKTVKNYLSNAMGKLNIGRRSEAAAFYARYINPGKHSR